MRRQNQQLPRSGSRMEIEFSRQSSSTSDAEPHIDPRFSGLQISRDNKRSSERQEIAELRRQSRLSETTSSGILPEEIPEERGSYERQSSTGSDSPLQLLSPIPDPANTNQSLHGNPFTFLTSLLEGASRPQRANQNNNAQQPNADQSSPVRGTTNESSVQNPSENGTGRVPQGSIVVRTVQPGPNGSNNVRMRVISLEELLGRQEGTGNNQPGQPGQEGSVNGLFGALMNMLSGLQGQHSVELGNYFNVFPMERGLEKEVLKSLPLVTYNKETFKNVEEESKTCPICLEHFEDGNEVRYLWCIHRFHKSCVDQWLDKHTNCPICKKDYSEAEKSFE